MSLDRGLALVGLVLALPGFLLLFLSGQEAVAVLVLVLGAGCLIGAFVVHFIWTQPPYTFKIAEVTLSFIGGKDRALLSKEYIIRPNYRNLQQMKHKNIASDGTVKNICWNDEPVPQNKILTRLGEYAVTIDFPTTCVWLRNFTGKLSYELINSFGGNSEGIFYSVDYPTKKVIIRVNFPEDCLCIHAHATLIQGAGEKEIQDPAISSDRKSLVLKLKRPKLGSQYGIYWQW